MGLQDGAAGTLQTLKLMRSLVREYKIKLPIRELALKLVAPLKQKNFVGEVKAIHKFVRDEIRYVRDIVGVETIQTPVKTLDYAQGDCDDKATLAASLLEAIGHPTRFTAVGFKPGQFSHVLVETKVGRDWVAVETTEPVPLGWRPPGIKNKMIVGV